jgi:putative peptidoglycan binding protein
LNALGYEVGPVDGVIGADTRSGIQRFQRVTNLPATGELTSSTAATLRNTARNQGIPPAGGIPQLSQPPLIANAQIQNSDSHGDNGNLRIFRELGLRLANDESAIVFGNVSQEEQRAYSNFFKLLRLKARPELIDSPRDTIEFTTFLSSHEASAFLNPNMASTWKGRDQFEVEDSRLSFLAQHRARILSLVPSFPIAATTLTPLLSGLAKY